MLPVWSLLLLLFLSLNQVDGHFLFAEYEKQDDLNSLRVTFHEPGSDPSIKFVKGRLYEMVMYYSSYNSTKDDDDDEDEDENDHPPLVKIVPLRENEEGTAMIPKNNNDILLDTPTYLTGYLDYGPFPELDPPPDLQYTYSAQTTVSATTTTTPAVATPEYYWNTFYKTELTFGLGFNYNDNGDDGKFRIAFRDYGASPYEVLFYGPIPFLRTKNMTVCVFQASDGTAMGCQTTPLYNEEDPTNTVSSTLMMMWGGNLHAQESYLVLANTSDTNTESIMNEDDDANIPIETITTTLYYSSTSLMMQGEGSKENNKRSSSASWISTKDQPSTNTVLLLAAGTTGILLLLAVGAGCHYQQKRKQKKYNTVKEDEHDIFDDDMGNEVELSSYRDHRIPMANE